MGRNREEKLQTIQNELLLSCHQGLRASEDQEASIKVPHDSVLMKETASVIEAWAWGLELYFYSNQDKINCNPSLRTIKALKQEGCPKEVVEGMAIIWISRIQSNSTQGRFNTMRGSGGGGCLETVKPGFLRSTVSDLFQYTWICLFLNFRVPRLVVRSPAIFGCGRRLWIFWSCWRLKALEQLECRRLGMEGERR